jgi:hypothetical protein
MNRKFSQYCVRVWCLASTLILAGCALHQAKGPVFSAPVSPSPGKALVYFYRPHTEKHGYNRTYLIAANAVKLPDMLHGGYYSQEVDPGHLRVASNTGVTWDRIIGMPGAVTAVEQSTGTAVLEFEVEAGRIYYVKCHPEEHTWYIRPRLYLVDNTAGEAEIKSCKLVPAK